MMNFINRQNKHVVAAVFTALLLILPLLLQTQGNAWVRIADTALLYVLLALGLNIVVGYAGLLDLGFVAFFALGAGYIGSLTGGILGSHYQDIFAFLVLILVLTLRPAGLLGERVADRA